MENQARKKLRAGSVIEYAGMRATVVADAGGETLDVDCEGHRQSWRWSFEGECCVVVSEPFGELSYDTFDAYVKDFPAGDRYRAWVTNRGRNEVALIRLIDPEREGSPHGGLPGNYMAANFFKMRDGSWRLCAHDCDDGLMLRDWPADGEADARRVIEEMKALAPFSMRDLSGFDLTWQ